jgi:hypothetical protein
LLVRAVHYLSERLARSHGFGHRSFTAGDGFRDADNRFGVARSDKHHSAAIRNNKVSGSYGYSIDLDWFIPRFLNDPAPRGDRYGRARIDRQGELSAFIDIAAGTVDDDALNLTSGCPEGEDSAPPGDIEPSFMRDDDHIAGPGSIYGRGAKMAARRLSIRLCQLNSNRAPRDSARNRHGA